VSDYRPEKKEVLVDGNGPCRFYLGVTLDGHPIIGIEHPDLNGRMFITGPVLANMVGWIARKRKDLKPISLH
jgi:hypothetical protein